MTNTENEGAHENVVQTQSHEAREKGKPHQHLSSSQSIWTQLDEVNHLSTHLRDPQLSPNDESTEHKLAV